MLNKLHGPFEITFLVETDLEGGAFVASWDDPEGGGITTQADTLRELAEALKEAAVCHFSSKNRPVKASLKFAPAELQLA